MRRLALVLGFLIFGFSRAVAGVSCVLPFTITNGTLADATQIQANYAQLVNCMQTLLAASGANSDITSLLGMSTPLSPSQGGSPVYTGGVSTGAANAQVVALTVPAGFALTAGYQVNFKAGFTNTGPTTLAVGSTAATAVFRQTDAGAEALASGEIQLGKIVQVVFDGTQFQIVNAGTAIIGEMRDYAGTTGTPPPGWLLTDGSCQLRATYPSLFAAIGTVYDVTAACDVNHFALPDYRGRVTAYKDNMGGSTAGRITVAGGNFNGTTVGAVGGLQNHTQTLAELAAHTHTDSGHTHTVAVAVNVASAQAAAATDGAKNSPATTSSTGFANIQSAGGGGAFTVLNPVQIAQKIIKF